jgi:hypothetical protein
VPGAGSNRAVSTTTASSFLNAARQGRPGRRGRPGRLAVRHCDVSGGWLRPTVSGAVDGLVTSASLIAGVGGGVPAYTVALTGVAALSAISTLLT